MECEAYGGVRGKNPPMDTAHAFSEQVHGGGKDRTELQGTKQSYACELKSKYYGGQRGLLPGMFV